MAELTQSQTAILTYIHAYEQLGGNTRRQKKTC